MRLEVILKYGGRDISESSLVFSRSKGGKAKRQATTFTHPRHKPLQLGMQIHNYKAKVHASHGRKMPT